jgi:nucleoporin p58/p45
LEEELQRLEQHSRLRAAAVVCLATPAIHSRNQLLVVFLEAAQQQLSLSSNSKARPKHREDSLDLPQPSLPLALVREHQQEVGSLGAPPLSSNKHHRRNSLGPGCLAHRQPIHKIQIQAAAEASLDSHKQSRQAAFCKLCPPRHSLSPTICPLTPYSGQSQPQANQPTNQVSAVQINYDNLRPRSRFDDLAQPIQDEVALIDKGISRVIKMRDEIGEFMPQHERDLEQLGRDVKFVESKFRTVQDALNRDIQTVKALQDVTKKNIGDAQLSFKATDNLKLPNHYHQTGLFAGPAQSADSNSGDSSLAHASAQDLITYFNRICDDVEKYKKRLDEYRGEIERDMPGVENGLYEQIRNFRDRNGGANGAGNGGVKDQLNQILSALRETGNAIVAQAGQIADTRERLSRLQAGFLDSGLYSMGMAS